MPLAQRYRWDKPKGPPWFQDLVDDIYDRITKVQPIDGLGTAISETETGRSIATTGAGGGGGGASVASDYTFKMTDASDTADEGKVLILDGGIWGPNNGDIVYPDGMPSEDTYQLVVTDNDEIWVGMTWTDTDPPIIISAWIDHGPATPDDDETTTYVTLGYVSVEFGVAGSTPKVFPANQQCGDIIIQLPPAPPTDNFVLMMQDGNMVWAEVCDTPCGPPPP
jgi:hypothetical protein